MQINQTAAASQITSMIRFGVQYKGDDARTAAEETASELVHGGGPWGTFLAGLTDDQIDRVIRAAARDAAAKRRRRY